MRFSSVVRSALAATTVAGVIGAGLSVPTPTPLAQAAVSTTMSAHADVVLVAKVITVAGTYVPFFPTGTMEDKLNGVLSNGNDVEALPYPASLSWSSQSKGKKALTAEMSSVEEYTLLVGYSQGAEVIGDWLEGAANDPNRPAGDKVAIVLIAWPKVNAMNPKTTIETPYETIIVGKMFDGFTDMPNKFSFKALANAIAGMTSKAGHLDYNTLNFDDPRNMIMVNGKVTKVLFYTEHLPKNQWLRNWGLDELADKLDERDRKYIDAAYDRDGYELAEEGQIRALLEGVADHQPGQPVVSELPEMAVPSNRSFTLDVPAEPLSDTPVEQPEYPSPSKKTRTEPVEEPPVVVELDEAEEETEHQVDDSNQETDESESEAESEAEVEAISRDDESSEAGEDNDEGATSSSTKRASSSESEKSDTKDDSSAGEAAA